MFVPAQHSQPWYKLGSKIGVAQNGSREDVENNGKVEVVKAA